MGKAFKRLEGTVAGRRAGFERVVTWQSRLRAMEVYLLELGAYLQTVAVDKESPTDTALNEAHEDFKRHLEGVLK